MKKLKRSPCFQFRCHGFPWCLLNTPTSFLIRWLDKDHQTLLCRTVALGNLSSQPVFSVRKCIYPALYFKPRSCILLYELDLLYFIRKFELTLSHSIDDVSLQLSSPAGNTTGIRTWNSDHRHTSPTLFHSRWLGRVFGKKKNRLLWNLTLNTAHPRSKIVFSEYSAISWTGSQTYSREAQDPIQSASLESPSLNSRVFSITSMRGMSPHDVSFIHVSHPTF